MEKNGSRVAQTDDARHGGKFLDLSGDLKVFLTKQESIAGRHRPCWSLATWSVFGIIGTSCHPVSRQQSLKGVARCRTKGIWFTRVC